MQNLIRMRKDNQRVGPWEGEVPSSIPTIVELGYLIRIISDGFVCIGWRGDLHPVSQKKEREDEAFIVNMNGGPELGEYWDPVS